MDINQAINITENGINNFLQNKEDATEIYEYLVSVRSFLLELKKNKADEGKRDND